MESLGESRPQPFENFALRFRVGKGSWERHQTSLCCPSYHGGINPSYSQGDMPRCDLGIPYWIAG